MRRAIVAAVTAAALTGLAAGGTAAASTGHALSPRAIQARELGGQRNYTGTVSGGGLPHTAAGECAWTYQWDVNTGASRVYSWIKWTKDPCNYRMQDRGEFTAPIASHYTKFSGWVQSVGIISQVTANGVFDSIDHAAEHIYYPTPRTYSKWHTFWNG